jgi:hypothetical protein
MTSPIEEVLTSKTRIAAEGKAETEGRGMKIETDDEEAHYSEARNFFIARALSNMRRI